jgi:TetR/AcrR family transcriptional repressor of nem operon
MARPRAFDLETAKAALLDVFWRKGYASASLHDLCAATGLQHASLYAAFGNKDAMFRCALDRYAQWIAAAVATEAKGLDGARATVEAVVRLTLDDPERRGCPMINAIAEGELSAEARAAAQAGLDSMRRRMRRFARDAAPERPEADYDQFAAVLLGAVVSIRVLGRAGVEPRILWQIAEGAEMAALAWAGPTPPA